MYAVYSVVAVLLTVNCNADKLRFKNCVSSSVICVTDVQMDPYPLQPVGISNITLDIALSEPIPVNTVAEVTIKLFCEYKGISFEGSLSCGEDHPYLCIDFCKEVEEDPESCKTVDGSNCNSCPITSDNIQLRRIVIGHDLYPLQVKESIVTYKFFAPDGTVIGCVCVWLEF